MADRLRATMSFSEKLQKRLREGDVKVPEPPKNPRPRRASTQGGPSSGPASAEGEAPIQVEGPSVEASQPEVAMETPLVAATEEVEAAVVEAGDSPSSKRRQAGLSLISARRSGMPASTGP